MRAKWPTKFTPNVMSNPSAVKPSTPASPADKNSGCEHGQKESKIVAVAQRPAGVCYGAEDPMPMAKSRKNNDYSKKTTP